MRKGKSGGNPGCEKIRVGDGEHSLDERLAVEVGAWMRQTRTASVMEFVNIALHLLVRVLSGVSAGGELVLRFPDGRAERLEMACFRRRPADETPDVDMVIETIQ